MIDPAGWGFIDEYDNSKVTVKDEKEDKLKESLEDLSYKSKQELVQFAKYLKFKEQERNSKVNIGKISFDRFKKIVSERINNNILKCRIIYENYEDDDSNFIAELLYMEEPFSEEDYSITLCQGIYGKEEEKLIFNYSVLWKDMIDAIMKIDFSKIDEMR